MNIEDYKKLGDYINDITHLQNLYLSDSGMPEDFLRHWLEAAALTEAQMRFLVYQVQEKYDEQWFKNLYIALEKDDISYMESDYGWSLYKLLGDLVNLTGIYNLRINKIDIKYLENEARLIPFEIAENWAVTHGYLDGTGKWIKPINRLAKFLQVLLDARILNNSADRKEIFNYFQRRYWFKPLGDQIKKNKIKKSKLESEFASLQLKLKNSPN